MNDFDFIGFTYNNKHSIDYFGIYRTSDGSRYNDNLVPTITDKTVDVPGGDGQYYFSTHHKTRQFSIPIAFDSLTESKYKEMRQWLDGKGIYNLIFDEAPYKVYSAKVTGTPQLKTVCFSINGQRVYKGEGTIQFTCYYPYAHTPKFTKLNIGYVENKETENYFGQEGAIFYTLTTDCPITKDSDYTVLISISSITTENGGPIDSLRLNIGLSEIPKGTYGFSKYIYAKVGKKYFVKFSKNELKNLKNTHYFLGISSYVKDSEYKYKIEFDFYLCRGIVEDEEKFLVYNSKLPEGWQALYNNCSEWLSSSGILNNTSTSAEDITCKGENYGDIPAPFKVYKNGTTAAGANFRVGDNSITITNSVVDLEWDSKSGFVTGMVNGERKPIPFTGKSYGTIPVGKLSTNQLQLNGATLEYDYWYY